MAAPARPALPAHNPHRSGSPLPSSRWLGALVPTSPSQELWRHSVVKGVVGEEGVKEGAEVGRIPCQRGLWADGQAGGISFQKLLKN